MANVTAGINVIVNTSQAQAQLAGLTRQISALNMAAAASGTNMANNASMLQRQIGSTNQFATKMVTASSSVDTFTNSLEKNKMSLGQYTKYAASQMPLVGKSFKKEWDMIDRVATDRVKKLQSQYVAMGKSHRGLTQMLQSTPLNLNDSYATKTAVAAQKQMLMNKLIDAGSTKMLNWGKNTQWAGRQLMVGFSLPLAALGAVAAKTFMEIDKASLALRRVYGDLSTSTAEVENNVAAMKSLGMEYTKYGITLKDTLSLAARVAATGAQGADLYAATEQSLRFATLGQMDYNTALDATISMQTAFGISSQDLAGNIDYLNAVENQTILTIQDMALAIPRVAPVIKGLGGDVQDLSVMMTAMREGGVSAEQGANALKSGLASLINPTTRAKEVLNKFGIDLQSMLTKNRGDVVGLVTDFGKALSQLDAFSQQQTLEQVFGKYQYARMGALFKNMANDASQAARAIDLAKLSTQELAQMSQREMSKIQESTTVKFQAAMEQLKISIAPLGEAFLKGVTPIMEFITKLLKTFEGLPDGFKTAVAAIIGIVAGLGPVFLMTFGLLGNGFANAVKGIQVLRKSFARLKGDASAFQYLTTAEEEALAATRALESAAGGLTSTIMLQTSAVNQLASAYGRYAASASAAAGAAAMPGPAGAPARMRGNLPGGLVRFRYAGGVNSVPGSGSGDTVPALLTPGESVITKSATQKYGPLISAMNAGTLPGFADGLDPSKPVRSHGTTPIVLTPQQLAEYQAAELSKATPNKALARATSATGMTGWIYGEPHMANQNILTGTERGGMWSGQNPEMRSQILTPLLDSIGRQMSLTPEQIADNPRIRGFVEKIGTNMSQGLVSVGSNIVSEQVFQNLDSQAYQKALMDSPDLTAAERAAVHAARTDINTLSLRSAEHGNLGRVHVNNTDKSYRNVKIPATGVPIDSFLTPEGDRYRSAIGADGLPRSSAPATSSTGVSRRDAAAARAAKAAAGTRGGTWANGERVPMAALGMGPLGILRTIQRQAEAAGQYADVGGKPTFASRKVKYKESLDKGISRAYHSTEQAVSKAYRSAASAVSKMMDMPIKLYSKSSMSAVRNFDKIDGIAKGATTSAGSAMDKTKLVFENIKKSISKTVKPYKDAVTGNVGESYRTTRKGLYDRNLQMAAAGKPNGGLVTGVAPRDFGRVVSDLKNNVKEIGHELLKTTPMGKRLDAFGSTLTEAAWKVRTADVGAAVGSLASSTARAAKNIGNTANVMARALGSGDVKTAIAAALPGEDRRNRFLQSDIRGAARDKFLSLKDSAKVGFNKNVLSPSVKGLMGGLDALDNGLKAAAFNAKVGAELVKRGVADLGRNVKAAAAEIPGQMKSMAKNISGKMTGAMSTVASGIVTGVKSIPQKVSQVGSSLGGYFGSQYGLNDNNELVKQQSKFQEKHGGKMVGAGMALSMASMIPMMGQDENGKFMGMDAGTTSMGLAGAGGLMSMSGIIPAPVIAALAAIAAAGVAVKIWRNNVDDSAKAAAKMGANIGGTANALNGMASILGRLTPSQRSNKASLALNEGEAAAYGEFQTVLESDAGQKFIEDLKNATSADRFKMLSDYLKGAIATGMMDQTAANAFAKTIGSALNDAILANSTISALKTQKAGTEGMLDIARSRQTAVANSTAMKSLKSSGTGTIEEGVSATVIGSSIQVMQDFGNAVALAKEEFDAGTISYDQYRAVLDESTKAQIDYTNSLSSALDKSQDFGASMQAWKDQMALMGMTPEQQAAYENAATTKSSIGAIGSSGPMQDTLQFLNVPARYAATMKELTSGKTSWGEMAAAWFQGETTDINTELIAAMTSAKAQGLASDADIAAVGEKINSDVTSAAAQAYAKYKDSGNGMKAAIFAENVSQSPIAGLDTSGMQRYIDITYRFMDQGGNPQDIAQLIASIPEEKRIDFVTSMSGDIDAKNLEALLSLQRSSKAGEFLATSTMGASLASAGSDPYASRPKTLADLEASGQSFPSTGGADATGSRSASRAGNVDRAKRDAAVRSIDELKKGAAELEKVVGADNALALTMDVYTNYNGDPTKAGQMEADLNSVTSAAIGVTSLPEDTRKMFGIDLAVSDSFINLTSDDIDKINNLGVMINKLPAEMKQIGIDLSVDENGKPKSIKSWTADVQNATDIMNKMKSGKSTVRKQAVLEMYSLVNGKQITMEQLNAAEKDLMAEYGKQTIANLPPDIYYKAVTLQIDLTALKAALQEYYNQMSNVGFTGVTVDAETGDVTPTGPVKSLATQAGITQGMISSLSNRIGSTVASGSNITPSGPSGSGGGSNGGNGGGGGTNPIADMNKGLLETIKNYSDMNAILKDLFNVKNTVFDWILKNEGVNDKLRRITDFGGLTADQIGLIMGLGPKAAAKWLTKNTKGNNLTSGGRQWLQAQLGGAVSQQMDEARMSGRTAKAQRLAGTYLRGGKFGVNSSFASGMFSDPTTAERYIQLVKIAKEAEAAYKRNPKRKQDWLDARKAVKDYVKAVTEANYQDALTSNMNEMVAAKQSAQNTIAGKAWIAQQHPDWTTEKQDAVTGNQVTMDILIFQNSRIAALDAKWHDARGRAAKAAAKKRLDIAIKERDRMIAIAGEIYDLSITQQTNGLDEAETAWSNYADAVNAAFDAERIKTEASMAADFLSKNAGLAAQFTDAYGGAVDSGLELVDVLERQQVLNERAIAKQQEILDGKQKEISEQQRLNDLDQQKIDGMRRIDDLRLRESDALSHDLELMSQKETEINDAYQKKIDQLDKVLSINQQIVQSQQDQMSVAQALSQGDIYAAAAAAQQMRANYAANASDNLRTALETGKQNQIDGLLTSGGLTRDQVEARMNSIREQSYQTSLKIRDIEDDIYDRNQKILTLNNEIYDITQKEIVPLQEKNKQYSTLLANYKAEVDYAKSHLIAAGMTAEQWAAAETNHTALIDSIKGATDKVDAYRKAWEAAAEAARAALSAAGVETSATGATGTTAPSGTPDAKQAKLAQARIDLATAEWNKGNYAGARGYLNASKQYVDKANNADITRQYNNFDSVLKSVGFAGGGLVGGMGSGDTVPARLTPGEFVMSKATVKRYGAASMAAMNQNSFRLPKYETDFKNITVDPRSVSSGIANINAPVYNSVQVHVPNSNASPDDIANKVIYKMQQLDRSRIRGTNGR